jgi:hypothetical protein
MHCLHTNAARYFQILHFFISRSMGYLQIGSILHVYTVCIYEDARIWLTRSYKYKVELNKFNVSCFQTTKTQPSRHKMFQLPKRIIQMVSYPRYSNRHFSTRVMWVCSNPCYTRRLIQYCNNMG